MEHTDPVLSVRNLKKAYDGFTLDDVSVSLPPGFIMGLIGHNGAGKTTLLKSILNLVRPDGGEIRVFGMDHRRQEEEVRARIGFVHEVPTFYASLSVGRTAAMLANFYPTWDQATFIAVARDFDLDLRKKVGHLSQGMRTRFALAVALSYRAELLLLDEPSSGLDPAFRRNLLEYLSGLIQGGSVSVLFSTHITSDLDRIADFVTFLREGRLVFSDTREDVLDRWYLIKGGGELMTEGVSSLFAGMVEGEYGVKGLTEHLGALRDRVPLEELIVEKATLEDVVYYTGRTGKEGLNLRGHSN